MEERFKIRVQLGFAYKKAKKAKKYIIKFIVNEWKKDAMKYVGKKKRWYSSKRFALRDALIFTDYRFNGHCRATELLYNEYEWVLNIIRIYEKCHDDDVIIQLSDDQASFLMRF